MYLGKAIYLKLDTVYGVITIPFIGINEVDEFTIHYDNLKELVESLISMMSLKIDLYDVSNIYLSYDKYKREYDSECLEIKYKKDNFNYDSLVETLCEYLARDPKRIWKSDIRYVKTDGMISFMNTGRISRFEIKKAVNAHLSDERGYRRKRDVYFFLKETFGNDLNIKIDKVLDDELVRDDDLSRYDSEDDSYLSHLIELYRRGDYGFEEAMEQIAKLDLYELETLLKHNGYGIVDGVSEKDNSIYRDIRLLERCTGMSLDNLKLNYSGFGRKKGIKR